MVRSDLRCFVLRIATILLALVLFTQDLTAQQTFPYVAYVVHQDSYIRSGPGQRYYPTQQLPQGFALEIYRHDSQGWCAIRPPEGSFSWVAAYEVRLLSNNTAEVIADKTVTRVGSTLSPTRSAVQVMLRKGERVSVVPGQPSDDPNWLRVVPPAGEFRWIAANDLGRQAPMEVTAPALTSTSKGKWSRARFPGEQMESSTPPPVTTSTSSGNAFDHLRGANQAMSNNAVFQATPLTTGGGGHVEIVAGSPAELQLAQFQRQAHAVQAPGLLQQPYTTPTPGLQSPSSTVGSSETHAATSGIPRVQFGDSQTTASAPQTAKSMSVDDQERIVELQLRLSQIVSQPPTTWQFDQISSEAETLLKEVQSSDARAEIRDVIERIVRFRRIRAGYSAGGSSQLAQQPSTLSDSAEAEEDYPVPTLGAPVEPMAELVAGVRDRVRSDLETGTGDAISRNAKEVDESKYDAVGRLKPVVSRREGAPQYALVDDRGDVVSFVTPTPDLNLKPYVGRRVGINGSRGYMTQYRRSHVTAGRITQVEATVRR